MSFTERRGLVSYGTIGLETQPRYTIRLPEPPGGYECLFSDPTLSGVGLGSRLRPGLKLVITISTCPAKKKKKRL